MLTIEVHLIDIFPDFFRKETAHVMAFTDGIPQKSGGDFHQGASIVSIVSWVKGDSGEPGRG